MWCKIVVGDAREVLVDLPSNCVDLTVTSPPYFALKKYLDHPKAIAMTSLKNYLKDLKIIFLENYRVMKNGSFICVVVGQYTSKDKSFFIPGFIAKILEDIGFQYKREHIWVKPKGTQGIWNRGTTQFLKNPYPRNTMINIQHEHVLIFQKGDNRIEKTEKLTEREVKEYSWSIWRIPVSPIKDHPAPFPEELVRRLVKLYSYNGEIVFDPFILDREAWMWEKFHNRYRSKPELLRWSPLTSCRILETTELIKAITQIIGREPSLPHFITGREETLIYEPASRHFRADPYTGSLVGMDYLLCRHGETVRHRHRNLVIWFKNIRFRNMKKMFVHYYRNKCPFNPKYKETDKYLTLHLKDGCRYTKQKELRIFCYIADILLFKDAVLF